MLKDILLDSASMMGRFDLYSSIDAMNTKSVIQSEITIVRDIYQRDDVKHMINAIERTIKAITRDYIKNLTVENVVTDMDGKIKFTSLSKPIISIKNVTDELNNLVVFNVFYDHIKLPLKNTEVSVAYYYEAQSIDSIFKSYELPLGVTEHLVALGATADFLTSKLMYNEAQVFEEKFKHELEDAKPRNGVRYFPVWNA